ncbi:membrane-associated protein, putative [Bodo saltans]|uniref:Membrane-associated protein, putative n=1 Tax=Bodo saltans TaxID=75058 RepID=A0A0S4JT70_BODSA|nr:membrane-associated protein, putative [Bodo saltans]|eukprot:CUG93472.1 membrane-associated protein, putative [Bodo saltans]
MFTCALPPYIFLVLCVFLFPPHPFFFDIPPCLGIFHFCFEFATKLSCLSSHADVVPFALHHNFYVVMCRLCAAHAPASKIVQRMCGVLNHTVVASFFSFCEYDFILCVRESHSMECVCVCVCAEIVHPTCFLKRKVRAVAITGVCEHVFLYVGRT